MSSAFLSGSVESVPARRVTGRKRPASSTEASAGVELREGKAVAAPFGFWSSTFPAGVFEATDYVAVIAGDLFLDKYPEVAEWAGTNIYRIVDQMCAGVGAALLDDIKSRQENGRAIKRVMVIVPRIPGFNTMAHGVLSRPKSSKSDQERMNYIFRGLFGQVTAFTRQF